MRGRCVLLFKSSGSGRVRQSCLLLKSPAVAVRSRCVFAVQVLRQLPCEEVVLYLCWTSPPAEAVRGSRVFCSSLRQWPCEAVVFAEQALRQRLGKAVVPSLNKSSGSGRFEASSRMFGVLLCETHASNPPASGRLRLKPESPVCYCMKMATRYCVRELLTQ